MLKVPVPWTCLVLTLGLNCSPDVKFEGLEWFPQSVLVSVYIHIGYVSPEKSTTTLSSAESQLN